MALFTSLVSMIVYLAEEQFIVCMGGSLLWLTVLGQQSLYRRRQKAAWSLEKGTWSCSSSCGISQETESLPGCRERTALQA